MSPTTTDHEKIVPAILDLTDSIITLLNTTSHRETSTNHTMTQLRTLLIRERKTVQRQNNLISNLRTRLSDAEEQLCAVQQSLKSVGVCSVKIEEGEEKEMMQMNEIKGFEQTRQEVSFLCVEM